MSASASAGSSSRWHRRFPTPTSFEPHGPRSTVRLSEPSAHRRTPKSHDSPNNPANPPQRARSCAQMTGAGCGIGEVNLPQHSIKWREKSGLAEHILKHAFADYGNTVEFDRRAHHRQIKMPGGVAPGEFVGAGGKQEIAGNRAQLGAVGVAL